MQTVSPSLFAIWNRSGQPTLNLARLFHAAAFFVTRCVDNRLVLTDRLLLRTAWLQNFCSPDFFSGAVSIRSREANFGVRGLLRVHEGPIPASSCHVWLLQPRTLFRFRRLNKTLRSWLLFTTSSDVHGRSSWQSLLTKPADARHSSLINRTYLHFA